MSRWRVEYGSSWDDSDILFLGRNCAIEDAAGVWSIIAHVIKVISTFLRLKCAVEDAAGALARIAHPVTRRIPY